jgi:hypothetical protein
VHNGWSGRRHGCSLADSDAKTFMLDFNFTEIGFSQDRSEFADEAGIEF